MKILRGLAGVSFGWFLLWLMCYHPNVVGYAAVVVAVVYVHAVVFAVCAGWG